MQRKNSILTPLRNKHRVSKRDGMAMMMAIAVIVIMMSIMALSLSMTMQTSKKTTDLYLYEQSVLLSQSATEYALLQIAQNNPCTYTGGNFVHNEIYSIDIAVSYIYASNASCNANGGTLYTTVTTPEQDGSAIIDVTITTDKSVSIEPIHFFRRSIQKL